MSALPDMTTGQGAEIRELPQSRCEQVYPSVHMGNTPSGRSLRWVQFTCRSSSRGGSVLHADYQPCATLDRANSTSRGLWGDCSPPRFQVLREPICFRKNSFRGCLIAAFPCVQPNTHAISATMVHTNSPISESVLTLADSKSTPRFMWATKLESSSSQGSSSRESRAASKARNAVSYSPSKV